MNDVLHDTAIAVVGMAGRFPGARSIDEFWENLRAGKEAISLATDEELEAAGVASKVRARPNYVKAIMRLEEIDQFDAAFFGYTPQQAASIDPQQRLFLECAWEAVESAGYNVAVLREPVGVFGGSGLNKYLLSNWQRITRAKHSADLFQSRIDSDKDFLTTRVSYKLNLTGPSIAVQTGCSTSLVAVHLACQSLLNFECDMALAGGVSLQIPHGHGYLYNEGGIASPDGHCRAFDADAKGTIFGSGVAIVVLKRLADALESSDTIYAIIKGSAVTNDGSRKVGFAAPGLHGQAKAIATALAVAGKQPHDIGMIEGHGTGTILGDAVELAALTDVFGVQKGDVRCVLGSVKTNIGHLDAAAGVTGLIKAILCLKHKEFVASLNLVRPNKALQSGNSPFQVNTRLRKWEKKIGPRCAGVSSFGIGGTNAHVILEEAATPSRSVASQQEHVVPLSARSTIALKAASRNLLRFLDGHRDEQVADVAFTLQVGRKRFNHRRVVLASQADELIAALEQEQGDGFIHSAQEDQEHCPVVFMFPGHGCEYAAMAGRIYDTDEYFRQEMDGCAKATERLLNLDVREAACGEQKGDRRDIDDWVMAQLALFAVEYSLAKLWMRWGVQPAALIGHSTGEYAAACLAQVFSLEDAIALVAGRARAMAALPPGAMIAVRLGEKEAVALLDPALELAASNAPSQCIISGPMSDIEKLTAKLARRGTEFRRLAASHAYHSRMMEPAARAVGAIAARTKLNAPTLPYVSSVTGTWATATDIATPAYWSAHILRTVRFSAGLRQLAQDPRCIFLEVGPGESLTRMARQHSSDGANLAVSSSFVDDDSNDRSCLLRTLGRLWLRGAAIDWHRFHSGERRCRVALPTYPFERQRYWIEREDTTETPDRHTREDRDKRNARLPIEQWFYMPSWQTSLSLQPAQIENSGMSWLILADRIGLGDALIRRLTDAGCHVVSVTPGNEYAERTDDRFVIDPRAADQYQSLLLALKRRGATPHKIIHCWSLTEVDEPCSVDRFDRAQDYGYFSLLYLLQAMSAADRETASIRIVTNYLYCVAGDETCCPEKAPLAALGKIAAQEFSSLECAIIDLPRVSPGARPNPGYDRYADAIIAEALRIPDIPVIAYRGSRRMVKVFEPVQLETEFPPLRRLRSEGCYVIVGGLGKIGLELADYLARRYQARLLLINRTAFPDRSNWDAWLERHEPTNRTCTRIRRIQAMEAAGASVLLVAADVSDEAGVERALIQAEERFGSINGLFHLAVETNHPSLRCPLIEMKREDFESQIRPKVRGLYVLDKLLKRRQVDFGVLFSSNASILGGIGFGAYSAANAFLDHAVADHRSEGKVDWIAINWDAWLTERSSISERQRSRGRIDPNAITAEEGLEALGRVISSATVEQIVVSATKLGDRSDIWVRQLRTRQLARTKKEVWADDGSASALPVGYIAPRTDLERAIASIWEEVLGRKGIGVGHSFLELGGDSLIALRVVSRINDLFHVHIPLPSLVGSQQTVSALATQVVTELARQRDPDFVGEKLASIQAAGKRTSPIERARSETFSREESGNV